MSRKITVFIVEDEIVIAEDIRQALLHVGYEVLGVARDYEGALKVLDMEVPDLLLLDITLKGEKTGIDIAQYVADHFEIPFIYITSYANKETLAKALKTEPYGYLVKPFNQDDLYTSIELALHKFNTAKQQVEQLNQAVKRPFADSMFVKTGGMFTRIRYDEITHLEAEGVYTNVYTLGEHKYVERQILLEFEKQLNPSKFMRVHRSYIVNLDHLKGVRQDEVLVNNHSIPLGRTHKEKLLKSMR